MELREIKKEVHNLLDIETDLKNFNDCWVKPLKKNNNSHLPSLKDLDPEIKAELNQKLLQIQKHLKQIETSQLINEKLKSYSRYLIELKLTTFNNDQDKSKMLTNQLLNDDFLNLKQTIIDVKSFGKNVQAISEHYHKINDLLHEKLSLEEILAFTNLPHKRYLYNLIKTSRKQKNIVRDLGNHFVSLTREIRLKKRK